MVSRTFTRSGDHLDDEPVSRVIQEVVEVTPLFPHGIQEGTAVEIVVPVPQIQEQIVQVGKVILQERFSERMVEIEGGANLPSGALSPRRRAHHEGNH